MSSSRRDQLLNAYERNLTALTVELARLHIVHEPGDRTALLIYGEALTELARYEDARRALEQALELSDGSDRASALRLLARLADARGEVEHAERLYGETVAAAPAHASAYIYWGAMLARHGRLDEAESLHQQATGCTDGALDEAWLNLGLVQRARGDYLSALDSLRKSLSMDPTDSATQDALLDVEAVLFDFPRG